MFVFFYAPGFFYVIILLSLSLSLFLGLMPLPTGLPNLGNIPNLNLPAPHLIPGPGLTDIGHPGMFLQI